MANVAWASGSTPAAPAPAPALLAPYSACGRLTDLILCKRCGGPLGTAEQARMAGESQ
ncbi:hypothetical protein [Deinococcus sp.]|uniref:hypothetical protein n=1 Tax=Deinococcus sp. TaxID=47478 RepID=UPI0025D41485|nr:hypothetical protein [Deinococcus sp.]